ACALLPAGLYMRNAIGGGDVKLFAAVGALCHPLLGLRAELYSFAFGGLYALAIAGARGCLPSVLLNVVALVKPTGALSVPAPPPSTLTAVRFGPVIFVGTAASMWMAE